MAARDDDQILALAGLFQAIGQVQRIATHGRADSYRIEPCVRALLGTYESDLAALYGGREALAPGLHLLVEHLQRPDQAELTRYLIAILHLERKVTRQRQCLTRVISGLRHAANQADYFGSPLHASVVRNIGALYSDTVSKLRPRIMVQGERGYLEEEHNAALIRTLLLAAIRSASLWRQLGGGRMSLIIGRKRLVELARAQLASG